MFEVARLPMGTVLGSGHPAGPSPLLIAGLAIAMLSFTLSPLMEDGIDHVAMPMIWPMVSGWARTASM